MRSGLILPIALFLWSIPAACHSAQGPLQGSWTGGFRLDGRWTAVNVRFTSQPLDGTADLIFPYYGGRENAINVALESVRQDGDRVHLEIPTVAGRVVLDGRSSSDTIAGRYLHARASGTFGLIRRADVPVETLERYYGAYQVTPDRVISILRGWGSARTLNYVDYQTGQVGTLWPSSDTAFFSGTGLAVAFPVTLRVSFERAPDGTVTGLVWRAEDQPALRARKLEFHEERVVFTNGDVSLGGTLISPATRERRPVVIVTPGDYGTNRNQLRMWAHNFVTAGVSALVFDSRGTGESGGAVNSSSFPDLANDVLAAVRSLRMRADVDPGRIGLFGFSNSGFTVSLAASRSPDVAFLILQSLVGVVPWKQETYRAETQLRVDGFPDSIVRQGREFMELKYEVARSGTGWERLRALMDRARGERWLAYTNPPNDLERLRQVYQSIMTYDPMPALENLRIPVLAVWGAKDTYLPVPETVANFRQAMTGAENREYVVQVYPDANHSLLVSADGSPSTGGTETDFAEGYWAMQVAWLTRHVTGSR
jgi:uncharacterized protein